MSILKIVIIAICGTMLLLIVKKEHPEIAVAISIITGVIIFSFVVVYLESVVSVISQITERINLDLAFVDILLKIIAISYLCEFGAQVCKDAGQTSISSKVEIAGKVIIVYLATPIILSLINMLTNIL